MSGHRATLLGACLAAGIALSGCGASSTPAPVAPLPDPCNVISARALGEAFALGVAATPEALSPRDGSSGSCMTTVHTRDGDIHVVVTVAANGPGAFRATCSVATAPISAIGVGACWNADDVSASTLERGRFYSVAITDPVDPEEYRGTLIHLLASVAG